MVVDKCLALCYRLVNCRMICRNTNAACINIYCSSLWQKGEVHEIHYILEQTSHDFFLQQLSGYLTVIVTEYPDSYRSNSSPYDYIKFQDHSIYTQCIHVQYTCTCTCISIKSQYSIVHYYGP